MKCKLMFPVFALMLLTACEKDDSVMAAAQPPLSIDEAMLLTQSTPKATGYLNGEFISWAFGFNTFQSFGSSSAYPGNPVGSLSYGLTEENNGSRFFQISTPVYDTASPAAFEAVFGLGEKSLGNMGDRFYIEFKKGDQIYKSENTVSGQIKVLKTQEYIESGTNTPYIRVWFRVMNSTLRSYPGADVRFDGVIIAQFYGYKL